MMEGACDPSNPPVAPLLQPLQLNLRLSHWRVFTQCALTIELPDDVIAIRSSSASGRFQPQCVLSLPLSLSLSLSRLPLSLSLSLSPSLSLLLYLSPSSLSVLSKSIYLSFSPPPPPPPLLFFCPLFLFHFVQFPPLRLICCSLMMTQTLELC